MNHSQNQNHLEESASQQSLGDVQVQGDDNTFNVIQAQVVTLTQTKIIQISINEIKTRKLIATSPYKGLKKFEPEDSDRFFGRDQFLGELVNELEQTNFILLLGASGSGKSSVVRAGLIPWLQRRQGNQFVSLMFTPDQDPFESLYSSLLGCGYRQSQAQLAKAGKVETLSQVVKTLKSPETFWFICIDQFEELFTTSNSEQCDRFITSLVNLNKERVGDRTLKILATMRSDFLDRLDPPPANRLARATNKHRPLMTQMHPDELRLAIEQPAAHHGVVFETGLVEEIIQDVQGQAGCLPLLQYTLNLLWEAEVQNGGMSDRTLKIASYRRLGGVRGALQQRVDRIYAALSQPEQLAVQRIFLKLVEIGGDAESGTEWKPVRRRAARSEFKDVETTVLAQLIDEMLLVSDRVPAQDRESTVEIAHEILLTSWTTLNLWIKENRQAIALRNRLNADVTLWQLKKANSDLWSGAKLEKVAELRKDSTFVQVLGGFDPAANQFIDASLGKRDRELRFYRNVAVGAIVGLVGITGSLIFAGIKWRTADKDQIQAELTSSNLLFEHNPASLDALVSALGAASHFQHSLWLKNDAQLRAKAMETLAETVYAVREHNRLEGHNGYVNSVSFSRDGQMIGTASYDKTAKLWSADGREFKTLEGHKDRVTDISFSPDGQTIATASLDKNVILWNRQGKVLHILKGHSKGVWSVQFSPDGSMIATASRDKTVKLWDLNGHSLRTFNRHKGSVYKVCFSPRGDMVATASADKTVKLWDLQGNVIRSFEGHRDQVVSVNFSPDGKAILSASMDKTTILWNRNTGAKIGILRGHSGPVNDAIFSPDGQTIATASSDKTVKLWRRDGTLLETLQGHQDSVNSISFNQNGNVLASASNDRTVKLWQSNPWRTSFVGHRGPVYGVATSLDGKKIASASEDATVKLWNLQGQPLTTFSEYRGTANSVSFSRDGKMLAATSSTDRTVIIWNLQRRKVFKKLERLSDPIFSVNFSPDGKTVVFASRDKTVKLWNYEETPPKSLEGHKAAVINVCFSRDGSIIASTDEDGIVKLWSRQGKPLPTWQAHTGLINSIRISPDGQTIATAGQDSLVKLWDPKGNFQHSLEGHSDSVLAVRFSPNGRMIATASQDKTVKLWTSNGELITTLIGHAGPVNSLSFTPDSKMLATVSGDSKMLLWNVENLSMDGIIARECGWLREDFKAHSDYVGRDVCHGIVN